MLRCEVGLYVDGGGGREYDIHLLCCIRRVDNVKNRCVCEISRTGDCEVLLVRLTTSRYVPLEPLDQMSLYPALIPTVVHLASWILDTCSDVF